MRGLVASLLFALAAQAVVEAPDPGRLAADWWSYLAPEEALEGAGLEERVAALSASLETLRARIEEEQRTELLPKIGRLKDLLGAYPAARNQQPVLRDALPPPAESYTVEEAFARHRVLVNLATEVASQQDEISWRRDLLAAERRQHSRAKVAYLERQASDPDRLEAGLSLMASRLEIETDALELERRQATLAQLLEQQSALEEEIEGIAARLSLTAEERAAWEKIQQTALTDANRIKDEKTEPTRGKADTGSSEYQSRMEALRILLRDLKVKKAELLAERAELTLALIDDAIESEATTEALKRLLRQAEQNLGELAPRRQYWRNAVGRVEQALNVASEPGGSRAEIARNEQGRRLITEVRQANGQLDLESRQLQFAADLAERRIRMRESAVERGWAEVLEIGGAGLRGAYGLLSESLFEINETPVTLFGLLRVVLFLTLAWLLSKLIRRGLAQLAERRGSVSQSSLYTLGRISHYVILLIGILIGLSSIGIDFTKFALLASALGIGIGFGMQALVSNFVAGLIILFEKSLKVGDFVELQSGVSGEVKEINMRSTLITTNDNVDILVPNAEFINNEVTNWTLREAYRRIRVPFGVAYGTDKDLVRKAGLEAADNVRWTLKDDRRRVPQVWFVKFGDSSLDFELVVWLIPEAVKRPAAVQATYLWELDTKLHEYGIEIPFPQRDLHLRSGFDQLRGPAADGEAP